MHARTYPRVGVTAPCTESPFGVVTMSVHKLTAGSGYDYLTRQVAVQSQRGSLRNLQHCPGTAPPRQLGDTVCGTARSDPAKRPIREIVGVDPRLNQR
jgi:hypothetical protein